MQVGTAIFVTDQTIRPDELAREVESRGFESLFVTEHTHMPLQHSRLGSGTPLCEEYKRTLDPFVALSLAAAATTRLRLGTGICLVAQHDPIVLAKQVATLDLLSGGRFVFGVGYGWNREELAHHGVRFDERREVARERILAMQALWTQEHASFAGNHVRFGPSWSWPKPVQRPHPPILVGAPAGPRTFAHIVEFADGWMPSAREQLSDQLPVLHRLCEQADRDPQSLAVTVFGADPAEATLARLEEEFGVDRAVLWLPSAPRAQVMAALDRLTAVLHAFHPGR